MNDALQSKHDHFLSLLAPVHGQLLKYVRAMVRHSEDARDIIGETLLKAYEHVDDLADEASFRFYLFSIARRLHWKWHRRNSIFFPLNIHHENLHLTVNPAEIQTDIRAMLEAMSRLPPRMRESLVLFEISGLSMGEIRALQGGTISGVKARVSRGRKRLSTLLNERDHSIAKKLAQNVSIVAKETGL